MSVFLCARAFATTTAFLLLLQAQALLTHGGYAEGTRRAARCKDETGTTLNTSEF